MISGTDGDPKIEKFNYFTWIKRTEQEGGPCQEEAQVDNVDDQKLYDWSHGRIPIAGELHIAVPIAHG